MSQPDHHRNVLFRISLCAHSFYFILLQLAAKLPLFDTSPTLVDSSPLYRWDVFHYSHIAQHGYLYEHEWAFFPGSPWIIRYILPHNHYIAAALIASLTCYTTITLYDLSLHHLRYPWLAFVAAVLSLLPTSPVTLSFAPSSEPFFTFLSYKGMLYCAQESWIYAALCFASAGLFRSNGIFLAGFIIWGILLSPFLKSRAVTFTSLVKTCILAAAVFAPFVYHHVSAYLVFCDGQTNPPEWCSRRIPSIYTYVQEKYWNGGLFRYWTFSQLPNFALAAPTLSLLLSFAVYHLRSFLPPPPISTPKAPKPKQNPNLFTNFSLTPHVLHSIFMVAVLLFASHTQIALRLAPSMPVLYWAAAWLVTDHPKWALAWISWSIVWGSISTVLWATFLPPA